MMLEFFSELEFVKVLLDDIIVHSKSKEEHARHLGVVFSRLENHSLKIKVKKCKFMKEKVRILGHVISAEGVSCDLEKIEKILTWPRPNTKDEVLSFVSLSSYCRKFIGNFS